MHCPLNLFDVEPTTGYHIKGQLFSCPEASELQRIQSSKKWKHITEQLNTKCLRLHKWPDHCSVNSNWWTSGYDNLPHKYEQSVWNSAQICRAEQFFDNVNETTIKLIALYHPDILAPLHYMNISTSNICVLGSVLLWCHHLSWVEHSLCLC